MSNLENFFVNEASVENRRAGYWVDADWCEAHEDRWDPLRLGSTPDALTVIDPQRERPDRADDRGHLCMTLIRKPVS